jgi:uncharacterized protein (DUF58 family)
MKRLSASFLTPRSMLIVLAIAAIAVIGIVVPAAFHMAWVATACFVVLVAYEWGVLWSRRGAVSARRFIAQRLSNGDHNDVTIELESSVAAVLRCTVIDELPIQFQERHLVLQGFAAPGRKTILRYEVRPVERGAYAFGNIHVYATTALGLVERRFTTPATQTVAVYPSYMQMRAIEMMAVSSAVPLGQRRMRRLGQTMEYETSKPYVQGDDMRTMNWKTTARSGQMMVNLYQDEREQHIYSVIDTGRIMKLPFNGMTLLDYSVNAALALSRAALVRGDRAGLVAYGSRTAATVPADRRSRQMTVLNEALYAVSTDFSESNDEVLFATLRRMVPTRSLLMIYTNIETIGAFQRRLPVLRALATRHVVIVTMFENTEITQIATTQSTSTDNVYLRATAEMFAWQKREIIAQMQQHGIMAVYARPENMGLATVQRYIDMKARGVI